MASSKCGFKGQLISHASKKNYIIILNTAMERGAMLWEYQFLLPVVIKKVYL